MPCMALRTDLDRSDRLLSILPGDSQVSGRAGLRVAHFPSNIKCCFCDMATDKTGGADDRTFLVKFVVELNSNGYLVFCKQRWTAH
jgi:hypothetical protein